MAKRQALRIALAECDKNRKPFHRPSLQPLIISDGNVHEKALIVGLVQT